MDERPRRGFVDGWDLPPIPHRPGLYQFMPAQPIDSRCFDPVENARAMAGYMQERYGQAARNAQLAREGRHSEMVPIEVGSVEEFIETFGDPFPGLWEQLEEWDRWCRPWWRRLLDRGIAVWMAVRSRSWL